MLLLKCVAAYLAVGQMMEIPCDYQTAHAMLVLKNWLKPHAEFYSKGELELMQRYGKKEDSGEVSVTPDGKFRFQDEACAAAYNRERDKLGCVEVQQDWKPVCVRPPERIQPAQLEALSGFLDFLPTEKGGEG